MSKRNINVKRIDVTAVNVKLNNMQGVNKSASAFLTILTLTKVSPKYKMAANAPFPAIVKPTLDGGLAIFNCVTAKQEIIPSDSYREPTPIGKSFEYKGHIYEKNPVLPVYSLKK